MISKLDLRRKGTLSIVEAKIITDIEPKVRDTYNKYICELIKENNLNQEQLLLRVTCRNTYISLIHDQFCRLSLLENQLNSGKIFDEIVLDDFYMSSAVKQLLKRYDCNTVIKVNRSWVWSHLLIRLNILLNIFFLNNYQ